MFPDRYHTEIITSPTQARHVLSYLLSNFRKHKEDRVAPFSSWKIDFFSSAPVFPDWVEYGDDDVFLWPWPPTYEPMLVFKARTWLLAEGWKLAGMPISCFEVPSAKR